MQKVEALCKELARALNERNRVHSETRILVTRVKSMVRGFYGPDSDEYELVGGTRTSERARPARREADAGDKS